jgi:hypothetical protein
MILRLSLKLNSALRGGTLAAFALDANPLLDWSVREFKAGRSKYVLLSNTRSLYSTVLDGVTGETRSRFAERVAGAVQAMIESTGCKPTKDMGNELAPEAVQFAKSLDRSVTGSINEVVDYAEILLARGERVLPEIGVHLNELLLSAVASEGEKYGKPREAFAALVDKSGS